MKQRGSGRIVNIVSCAGRVPIPTVGVYGGSKSALAMMANIMRLELEPSGVDVLNIYPGTVDTDLSRPFQARVPAAKLFDAQRAAQQLMSVIDGLTTDDNGGFLAWDGSVIPF